MQRNMLKRTVSKLNTCLRLGLYTVDNKQNCLSQEVCLIYSLENSFLISAMLTFFISPEPCTLKRPDYSGGILRCCRCRIPFSADRDESDRAFAYTHIHFQSTDVINPKYIFVCTISTTVRKRLDMPSDS